MSLDPASAFRSRLEAMLRQELETAGGPFADVSVVGNQMLVSLGLNTFSVCVSSNPAGDRIDWKIQTEIPLKGHLGGQGLKPDDYEGAISDIRLAFRAWLKKWDRV